MTARALRLHHRMVIPIVLVALVTTTAAGFISLALIRRALQGRVVSQLLNAATVVSGSDFPLNEAILRRVKEIGGTDVLTYTMQGAVLASTFDRQSRAPLVAAIIADRSIEAAPPGDTVLKEIDCRGLPCYVAYRRVAARPGTVVALVIETSELSAATRAVTRTIVLSAAVGLVLMVLVGQVVARRVTAPLDRLVEFTRDVSAGDGRQRAAVGDDEIGRLAAAFNDMLDRLQHAQQALVRSEKLGVAGLMAARVAHDIRNPLSSIKMQAQLLRSRVSGEDGRTMVQAVLHDVDQVESVIRGLLELAKPGEVTLRPEQLNDVLRQVLDHVAPQFAHRKIAIVRQLAPGLEPIPLDADRFKQAVINIINNAAEAMPNGGTLSIATRAEAGATVVLDVCDDGVGVDPAVLDRLFDPFVSTKREGVGLGLVNTKAVVEHHGGRVRIAPRTPRGTCVTISLPSALRAAPSPSAAARG